MIIVCGTQSDSEIIQMYQLFAVYIANELVKQHHLDVRIVSDISYLNSYHLHEQTNVFLLGGPHSNLLSLNILQENPLPLQFHENGDFSISHCHLSCHLSSAALFLAPYGDHLAFMVSASSISMFQSVTHILPLHTAFDSFPDFVVLDQSHEWKGGNAMIATGFWDAEWKLSPQSSFFQCPTYHKPQDKCVTLW